MIARLAHYFRVSFPFSFSTLSIIFLIIPFPQNLLFDVFFFGSGSWRTRICAKKGEVREACLAFQGAA
jgi:hypothetical protein